MATHYEATTVKQRLSYSIKALKDKYLSFKVEKEKFGNIYKNSYKHSSKYTTYQNWRYGYKRYTTCLNYGNTQDGDGSKYKGQGLLQLTWKNNYKEFKKRLKIDCVNKSELLSSDIKNACNMGGSWWGKPLTGAGDLNARADIDDLLYVTYGINGGLNGLGHRCKYTLIAVRVLGSNKCDKYKSLNVGDYRLETSKLNEVSSFKENGTEERAKERNQINKILDNEEEK